MRQLIRLNQSSNYKINIYNYNNEETLKIMEKITEIDKVIGWYMVTEVEREKNEEELNKKSIINNILWESKYNVRRNDKGEVEIECLLFMLQRKKWYLEWLINKRIIMNINNKSRRWRLGWNLRRISKKLEIFNKPIINKIFEGSQTTNRNDGLKEGIRMNENILKMIGLDLIISENKMLINSINQGNSLEKYLERENEGIRIKIKPILLRYSGMDSKIFNNNLLIKQLRLGNLRKWWYKGIMKKMGLGEHIDKIIRRKDNMRIINKNKLESKYLRDEVYNVERKSKKSGIIPWLRSGITNRTLNMGRNLIMNRYSFYKTIIGVNIELSGQYNVNKRKSKIKSYKLDKGTFQHDIYKIDKNINYNVNNNNRMLISEYVSNNIYNNTKMGKIGLKTKISYL